MKELRILLIEDDTDDIELIQDALQDNDVHNTMQVLKDGGSVSSYLEKNSIVPDIIVMDFNLPKVHGRDILKNIKRTDQYKHVPVVILTTSSSQTDIDYSYKEGASRYLIKPTTTEGFRDVVKVIQELAG
ncbi:response regulator [Sediminibacterium roseum]|uniref:Response regulator n=1 Tax=Sediminibacterium roseum TaxID=1978412 RepID=A0ABW9ZZA4_9BACT|nr:response regulator [Sediminibacterium roseum]NCI50513.1 response regulator [Sediminibacterium roseum]